MTGGGPLDVVGIGNALVDVVAWAEEGFLVAHGLVKGSMALVGPERAEELYRAMGPAVEVSGGSAANTLAGLASLGGRGAFIGRVGDDELGKVFAHDITALGVELHLPRARKAATGRSLIVVMPDGHRTMSTLLGAAGELGPHDVDEGVVARAEVTYLEGYLFDQEPAREAFVKASDVAHGAGRRVALTLSDSLCVDRWREPMRDLLAEGVDVLFGNEDELRLLYQTDDLDGAVDEAAARCQVVVVTRGPAGSTVIAGEERHRVPAVPVEHVVDTTGAGDLYAAGFLFGLVSGRDLDTCGRLGSAAAGEVVSHVGARPRVRLADLVAPLLV